jgi:hypothetical protein
MDFHVLSDRSIQLGKAVFGLIKESLADFHLVSFLIDDVQFVRTLVLFNVDKTPDLKVLKVDLTKVKGTKCADCCGCPTHFVDY